MKTQLSMKRLSLHIFFILLVAVYLLYNGAPLKEFLSGVLMFLLVDIIYLSSVIIKNLKVDPGNLSIKGKVVVITGGSSGIGYSLAEQLIKSGASHIVLIARNKDRLEKSVAKLEKFKNNEQNISYLSMDLTSNPEIISAKIKELYPSLKRIDVLVNCAGYSLSKEFQNSELKVFNDLMDTNYFASVYITRAVVPYMIQQKFGQIVYLSSVAGQLGVYGFTAYTPSKFAIRGFAETLYSELRPHGIGVSLVFPPDTETPGLEEENKTKPNITKILSAQGGVWKSEEVAAGIIRGIENRDFMIQFGSDGYFLAALFGGGCPPQSTLTFWSHTILVPFIRIYFLFLQNYFNNVIDSELKKEIKESDKKTD